VRSCVGEATCRLYPHRSGAVEGFSRRYEIDTLVYVELHESMYEAIQREKRIKRWNRAWKIRLIEENNPQWNDLAEQAF
jgi:putative endonuclease